MYAVEFDAKISDGMIKIPDKFVNKLDGKVKVIILAGESDEKKWYPDLIPSEINTKGFKFDRGSANER